MAKDLNNEELNEGLIALARCLLQYLGDCWLWAGEDENKERETIDRMIREQQHRVHRIADVLNERDWPVDLGNYPSEFAAHNLHYVALDYVVPQLIEDERNLADFLQRQSQKCSNDMEAAQILNEAALDERDLLEQLEKLVPSSTSTPA